MCYVNLTGARVCDALCDVSLALVYIPQSDLRFASYAGKSRELSTVPTTLLHSHRLHVQYPERVGLWRMLRGV